MEKNYVTAIIIIYVAPHNRISTNGRGEGIRVPVGYTELYRRGRGLGGRGTFIVYIQVR